MKEGHFWVVRVPKGQDIIEKVKKEKAVAIGFGIKDSISNIDDREELKVLFREARPESKEGKINISAGQLFRFAHTIEKGDWILTPNRDSRTVLFGRASSGYIFSPNLLREGFSHSRKVEWLGEFSRDEMSHSLRKSMGGASTVFNMDKHENELLHLMKQPGGPKIKTDGGDDDVPFYDETKAKADELIADMVSGIDPFDFQELVAGMLQSMGYRTRVSDAGPDHGVDVIAHPDVFGFEAPRIKVQVKHRKSTAGGPDIRNLIGTLGEGEKGLFVSTGGFTTEARNEARKNPRLSLVDSEEFVKLLIEHYPKMDSDYKAIVPLRRVWVPFTQK